MFGKKKKKETAAKKGIKNMDAVVTGAILGWVVASIYGVKKIKEAKKQGENKTLQEEDQNQERDKKPWFFARLFSRKK